MGFLEWSGITFIAVVALFLPRTVLGLLIFNIFEFGVVAGTLLIIATLFGFFVDIMQ